MLGDLNAVATIVNALQSPAISSMTAVWAVRGCTPTTTNNHHHQQHHQDIHGFTPQGLAPYAVEAFESMKQVVQSWSNLATFRDKLATMTPMLPYLCTNHFFGGVESRLTLVSHSLYTPRDVPADTYTSQLIWLEIHSSDSVVRRAAAILPPQWFGRVAAPAHTNLCKNNAGRAGQL